MFTISMDKRPIEQLEYDLEKFSERALPYAVRDTLNTAAYKTSDLARRNAKRVFQSAKKGIGQWRNSGMGRFRWAKAE